MTVVAIGQDAALLRSDVLQEPDGDPYYIGDCYEGRNLSNEWEIDAHNMPYLTHVKLLSSTWKTLRWLKDFMEVGTTPLRWRDLKTEDAERRERAARTNVTYLKYNDGRPPITTVLNTSDMLKQIVAEISSGKMAPATTHLLIVEDLSRDVIETLGSVFNIDPFFFREQVEEFSWHNTRDAWATPPALLATMKRRQWFNMRHTRLNYFASKDAYDQAAAQCHLFNVYRRSVNDQNHWDLLDKQGSIVATTRTKTSFWVGKTGVNNTETLGIILVDPTASNENQLWYGRENWLPTPSMQSSHTPPKQPSMSLYEELVKLAAPYPWFAENTTDPQNAMELIANPAVYTIAADWLLLCDYAKARLGQIEWELEEPSIHQSGDDAVNAALRRLHVWRKHIPVYREMLLETLNQAFPTAQRLADPKSSTTAPSPSEKPFKDIIPDFERIQAALDELQDRVDRLTSTVTAQISIEDSRRGLQENRNLARLTWLATTFIPLSYVTGLFSMSTSLADMKYTFGYYFAAAIPLTVLVLLIGGLVGNGWNTRKRNNRSETARKKLR